MYDHEYIDSWDIPSFDDEGFLLFIFCEFYEPFEDDDEEADINCLTCKRFMDTCKNGVVTL